MTETPSGADESALTSSQTDQRVVDAEYYRAELEKAVELLADLDKVNLIIAQKTADRPELLLSHPVEMVAIDWENPDMDVLDNFRIELQTTGDVMFRQGVTVDTDNGVKTLSADEIVGTYGGRGEDSFDYALQHGLKPGIRMFGLTHLSRAAYVRMWMIFPELTKKAMADTKPDVIGDEVRVAYEVMSRLVDRKDPLVVKQDGVVDNRYLTR